MRAHPAVRDDLSALLAAAPAEGSFAFVPGIDPHADSLLTWVPGQRTRGAIAPEGSGGQRMGLCFVLVSIPAPRDEWHEMEDGAAVLLTQGSWERFRRALEDGASIDLPMDVGASLSFAWIRDAYVSPIDGRVFGEGGDWATWLRGEPAPLEGVPEGERAGSLGRCSADLIVLSPGELLTSRVDVEDLAAYLKRVEAALRRDRDDEALAGLSLRIELAPAQRVTVRAGGPGVEDVEAVRATVGRITPVPDVKAEVLVELAFRAESA
jgi:hypothetical protein